LCVVGRRSPDGCDLHDGLFGILPSVQRCSTPSSFGRTSLVLGPTTARPGHNTHTTHNTHTHTHTHTHRVAQKIGAIFVRLIISSNIDHRFSNFFRCQNSEPGESLRHKLSSPDSDGQISLKIDQSINQSINQLFYSAPKSLPTANLVCRT